MPFRCPAQCYCCIHGRDSLLRPDTSVSPAKNDSPNIMQPPNLTVSVLLLCCLVAGVATGCAAGSARSSPIDSSASQRVDRSCNEPVLIELSRQRGIDTPADFPIGPGDVLTISVPEVDELQRQEIRVASDGTIGLPLIGTMQVA